MMPYAAEDDTLVGGGNPRLRVSQGMMVNPHIMEPAGYYIPPGTGASVPYYNNYSFPLAGPYGGNWEILQTHYLPAFFAAPEGIYDWAAAQWLTIEIGDVGDIVGLGDAIVNGFANQGEGEPLAFRLWHREVIDVKVPATYTLPSELPFGLGGTHDVPLVGGTILGSMHEWNLQIIYHNVIPPLVVLALIILAIFGTMIVADSLSHGQLGLTETAKTIIHDWSPSGAASALGTVFILGLALIVGIAIAVPQLQTALQIQGPGVGIGAGTGGISAQPARAARRR